jgi:hypothetical protein
MPNNNPRPPKRSWRDEGSSEKGHAPGRRKWHKEGEAKGPAEPRIGRGAKIALAAAALVAVGVGIWIVIEWLRPVKPFQLVLIGAGYESNLSVPHNVPGRRAIADLSDWAEHYNQWVGDEKKRIQITPKELASDANEANPLAAAIEEAKKTQKKDSPTVVVYLTAHAAVDGEGAFLLPNNADPKKRGGFYRLSQLLGTLKSDLKPETKKLLVIDATGFPVSWPYGVLHNDFASALREEVEKGGVENLVVLASCGDGQRSWDTEDHRRSVFGRAVVEGLSGKAEDRGRVTAASLAHYVEKEVHRWAWQNRSALQDPLLIDPSQMAEALELAPKTDRVEELESKPVEVERFSGLDKVWQERFTLAAQVPPPAAYAPGLWRKYQDTLLRYEELLRADDSPAAGQRKKELGDLKDAIDKARQVKADSLTNSLAMPAALGYGSEAKATADLREAFETLWNEPAKGTLEFKQAAGESKVGRLALQRFLVEKGRVNLKRAANLLKELGQSSSNPRAAEAQFAVMLNLGLQRPVDEKTIAKALAVRLRAEEAALGIESDKDPADLAAYSEQVLPWIKGAIKEADKDRRTGEDLLIAASRGEGPTAKVLSDADKHFDQAENQYQAVQKKARTIRAALAERDRALAELPYYTRWLARQNLPQERETSLIALWRSVHELSRLLGESDLDKLPNATKTVHDGLEEQKERFLQASVKARAILQGDLIEIEDLLTMPFMEWKDRSLRLREARTFSATLHERAEKDDGTGGERKAWDRVARAAAKRQGRLALAVLGTDVPGLEPGAVSDLLAQAEDNSKLDGAGKRVADAFARLSEEADKAPATKTAALQARRLGAVEAGDWLKTDPVSVYCGLLLRDLLVGQAERTFDDYWAAAEDKKPSYYREADELYLADAGKAAGGTEGDGGKALRENLKDEDQLQLVLDPRDSDRLKAGKLHVVHDEKDVTLRFKLTTPKSMPEGLPVVWPRVDGPGIKVAEGQGVPKVLANREPLQFGLDPTQKELEEKEADTARYVVSGYFRGREFNQTTEVRLHHRPDVTSYQPTMAERGLVAVQASREDLEKFAGANTELVIVLDYSGSMNTPGPDGKKRIVKVLDALEQCLREVPDGVRVSILTFSELNNENRTSKPFKREPLNDRKRTAFLLKLRGLEPSGQTPLVRATWEARDLFTEGFQGNKTLVVLTDGGDNTFASDKKLRERGNTIKEFMENEFKDQGISLYVIGFEIKPGDLPPGEEEGYKQFKAAVENKNVGGVFRNVDDVNTLVKELSRYVTQIPFWIEPDSNEYRNRGGRNRRLPQDAGTVRRPKENRSPVVLDNPGNYWVWMRTNQDKGGILQQFINLRRGEGLVLNLVPTSNGQFGFNLEPYTESAYFKEGLGVPPKKQSPRGPRDEVRNDLLLAVVQNREGWSEGISKGLRLTTVLENLKQPESNRVLEQQRPDFTWFEVADASNKDRPISGLRFYPLAHYQAPVYSLELKNWTRGAAPSLGAWWTTGEVPPSSTLERGKEFASLEKLTNYLFNTTPVGNEATEKVIVEKVEQVRRQIEVRPGEAQADVDCLVVRLNYPSGAKPYFVRLPPGVGALGHEHRFYKEAGKYVGIFWNVSPQQAQELSKLDVVSVEVARRGTKAVHVEGLLLPPPESNSRRPPSLYDGDKNRGGSR